MGNPQEFVDSSHWAIDDEVIQLRVRGSERVFALPASGAPGRGGERWLLGTAAECEIQLPSASGCIAERHALLLRNGLWWLALALGGRPNLLVDGAPQAAAQLVPGTELRIGELSLVAESLGSIALRDFLKQLLGSPDATDRALRQLRLAQTAQVPVILRGEEALLPIARELHHRVYGPDRPFVCYRELPAAVRGPRSAEAPSFANGAAAMAAARGGTLCLMSSSLPRDYERLCRNYADCLGSQTQIVVCDDAGLLGGDDLGAISIPPLKSRPHELLSLVFELGGHAMREVGLAQRFAVEDAVAVLRHDIHSFMAICDATRRLAMLRKTGSLHATALRLQVDSRALRRWASVRELTWVCVDQPIDQTLDRSCEPGAERSPERSSDRSSDRSSERSFDHDLDTN